MKIKIYLILFLSCWLASCASIPKEQPITQNKSTNWPSRAQKLSSIHQWDLKGVVAIRDQKQANSVSLSWQQQQQAYRITLWGPLGSGSYEVSGQPGKVTLTSSNGQHYYATSPESLLAQQTGWQLPVSYLRFWIRGLPVPSLPAEKNLDASDRLTTLTQDGWHIEFLRYTSVNGLDLPSKIFLNNAKLHVKIIINQWQL